MALKNQSLTVNYLAYDTSNNEGKTGDSANHTLRLIKDGGTPAAPSNSISEPDSTNMPGIYEITLTASEMNADFVTLHGVSSTSNIVIIPVFLHTERGALPAATPGSNGGLGTVDGNNRIAGIQGTKNTLDNLNDVSTSQVNAEVDNALDTAIPASPTADSINERIAAIDDLTESGGSGDLAAVLTDTNSLNDTKIPDTISLANINAEVDTALTDIGLDHLVSTSVTGTDIADDSIIAQIVSKSATSDWDTFDNTTDSLEALRDRGDAAWVTATGFSTHSASDVWTAATRTLTGFSFTVDANLTQVLGTAVTETTGGNLAGAFSNWYDVGTANNNVNSAPLGSSMRGTDNALLASSAPTNWGDLAITATTGQVTVGTNNDKSGYTLSTSADNSVADAVLNRGASNIEASADRHSLGAVVMIQTNSDLSGTTLTAKKPSDDTTFDTYTVTTDASADPITGVS